MKRNKFLMVVAMAVILVSCGGKGGGMPNFGDNEFPVQSAQTKDASMQEGVWIHYTCLC